MRDLSFTSRLLQLANIKEFHSLPSRLFDLLLPVGLEPWNHAGGDIGWHEVPQVVEDKRSTVAIDDEAVTNKANR